MRTRQEERHDCIHYVAPQCGIGILLMSVQSVCFALVQERIFIHCNPAACLANSRTAAHTAIRHLVATLLLDACGERRLTTLRVAAKHLANHMLSKLRIDLQLLACDFCMAVQGRAAHTDWQLRQMRSAVHKTIRSLARV